MKSKVNRKGSKANRKDSKINRKCGKNRKNNCQEKEFTVELGYSLTSYEFESLRSFFWSLLPFLRNSNPSHNIDSHSQLNLLYKFF